MARLGLVATCVLGLEEILEGELRGMGAREIERQRGAVSFSGDWRDCWRANWRLRTANRVLVELASWDEQRGLMKVNPIADWSSQELTAYIAENNIPVNPLHARGFISIGCQPCTRAVQPGEHPRAGRWWWEHEEKKECGLHMNPRREGKAA